MQRLFLKHLHANPHIVVFVLFVPLAVLVLGYTGRDDSHIGYFVADRLASAFRIENYSSLPVEQSSAPFFVLVLATIKAVLFPSWLVAAFAPAVSLVFYAACFGLVAYVCRHSVEYKWPLLIAITSPPLVYWSFSGMETSLYVLLLLALVFAARSAGYFAYYVLCCALLLTRPEAIFVLAATFTAMQAVRFAKEAKVDYRPFVALAGAVLTVFALKECLSLSFFPNPVYAKEGIALSARLRGGLFYPISTFLQAPITVMSALLCFGVLVRRVVYSHYDGQQTLVCALIGFLGAFPVFAGGDWMENGRFYVAPIFLALLFGLPALASDFRRRSLILGGLLFANVVNCFLLSTADWGGIPVPFAKPRVTHAYRPATVEWYNRIHLRDALFVDAAIAALDRTDAHNLILGSSQAGFVPYYLFQTTTHFSKFVDFAGLSSTELVKDNVYGQGFYRLLQNDPERLKRIGFRLPDFVFGLDATTEWPHLTLLVSLGCREVLRQSLVLHDASWKPDLRTFQFLVDCRRAHF